MLVKKPNIKLRINKPYKLSEKQQQIARDKLKAEIDEVKAQHTQQFSVLDLSKFTHEEDAYFKPKKKQISIRLDSDVLAWFQKQPGKYQQNINRACRLYMQLVEKSG